MAKIFITGGAGFIGSYIAKKLIKMDEEVIVYDAFVQYVSPFESRHQKYLEKRFEGLKDRIVIVRGDTRNKGDIRRNILKYKPDRILHLAALPIADLANLYSEEAITTILQGTANVLEVIRDVDFVKRFIYTSSSMIYGDFQYTPADEEHPKNPTEIYGGTKYAGEILTQSFGRRYGIEYTIVRPSAVYGPTDINKRVSQIFLENALQGEEIIVHGEGRIKLDFTDIEDVVNGFILAIFKEEAGNEIFNITRGEGRSIVELADIIKKYFPDLKIVYKQAEIFRPKRGTLDITKARQLLGYNPKFSLEDGMKKYIEFVKQWMPDYS